jgi:hypothetical protein
VRHPGLTVLPAALLAAAAAVAGCTTASPAARTATRPVPSVPVTTVPAWCTAYEPDQTGQAAVAGADGMTCHQLLILLAAVTQRGWVSTQAADGASRPRVAKLQHGDVTIRIWQGNDSGAAASAANELHAQGWAAMPGE